MLVPSALVSLSQGAASAAALLITTEVMVAEKTEKTDKTASPMLNGGMAEAVSNGLHWSTGERRRLSLNGASVLPNAQATDFTE